eukprot:1786721-Karenia_brevis.AAC.1
MVPGSPREAPESSREAPERPQRGPRELRGLQMAPESPREAPELVGKGWRRRFRVNVRGHLSFWLAWEGLGTQISFKFTKHVSFWSQLSLDF